MNGAKTAEQNTSVKYPLWPTSQGVFSRELVCRYRIAADPRWRSLCCVSELLPVAFEAFPFALFYTGFG